MTEFLLRKVFDQRSYLYKAQVFGLDQYDDEHKKHATLNPGFKFLAMPGADLVVVGVLSKDAPLSQLDDVKKNLAVVARDFFREILNPAIFTLSPQCQTRRHNLASTGQGFLPNYYRVYPEDVNALSVAIRAKMGARNPDILYNYSFLYYKYGQQLPLSSPLTLQSISMDDIVADSNKVECVSCHIAVTFRHTDDQMSIFLDLDRTASAYGGRKYPLFGLGEVGNVTSTNPHVEGLADAWSGATRDTIIITYLQAYTPLTKPMDFKPFADHPYLIYHLLGKEYVRSHTAFKSIAESVDGRKDYQALHEAIILMLYQAECRVELAVTTRYINALAGVNLNRLASNIKNQHHLVQVC